MKIKHLLIASLSIFLIISCGKEKSFETGGGNNGGSGGGSGSGGSTNSITGTYKLVAVHAVTSDIQEMNLLGDAMKTVTLSSYDTKNNTGTMTIDASKMVGTEMSYDIETTLKVYIYENGALSDSAELPWSMSLPPTNSTTNYTKVGSDSITFTGAGSVNIGGGSAPVTPGGYKYRWQGDTLVFIAKVNSVTTQTQSGVSVKTTDVGQMDAYWKKQ